MKKLIDIIPLLICLVFGKVDLYALQSQNAAATGNRNLAGMCFVDGVVYPTIATALAGCPSGTTFVSSASPAQTIYTLVTLSGQKLILDVNVTIVIAPGGTLDVGTNAVLDAAGATILVTNAHGNALQVNSGWANITLAHLVGPASGKGNGLVLLGAQFNQVHINDIHGFGGYGVLFSGVKSDGASRGVNDNTVWVQHNHANGTGVLWRNGGPSDFQDQNNRYFGGLVNGNINSEVQFGDPLKGNTSQDNEFSGFSDATETEHSPFIFENTSYNYVSAQYASSSAPAFSFNNSPYNRLDIAVGQPTELRTSQSTATALGMLQFSKWSWQVESVGYLNRDLSVRDAWWFKEGSASGAGGIQVFGGASQVVNPVFQVNGITKSARYGGTTNCKVGGASGAVSPAECGAAPTGMVAVPALQTTYTIKTAAVTSDSEIFLEQMTDNSGLPSSPKCNATATNPMQSARKPGTSFTFTLTSSNNVTCYKYWVMN